jgi:23S rRNA G2069 N7-methylase RlmK/C1962 C5-methylase RlmI
MNWKDKFSGAIERRCQSEPRLANPAEIGRLFAGSADGLDGVFVDSFGPLVVLTVYNPVFLSQVESLSLALSSVLHSSQVLLVKMRQPEGGFCYQDHQKILGLSWVAQEDDCRFQVRADSENDFGLFPDARPARLALRQLVTPESTVLNLFSYTCGFSVVAMKQGAQHAVNVDANAAMLTWGKENAALNGVDFAVVPELAQKYLRRLERRVSEGKITCPDIWVCDPPAFGVGRGQLRVLKHFWLEFWDCVERLSPRALVILRNDRTGHRRDDTLAEELAPRFHGRYALERLSFDQSPSLCYGSPDVYYKLNESLLLLRR